MRRSLTSCYKVCRHTLVLWTVQNGIFNVYRKKGGRAELTHENEELWKWENIQKIYTFHSYGKKSHQQIQNVLLFFSGGGIESSRAIANVITCESFLINNENSLFTSHSPDNRRTHTQAHSSQLFFT